MNVARSKFGGEGQRPRQPRGAGSKKSVQQGHSQFGARSVLPVREHGKWARTPLAAFFNMPIMAMPIAVRCEAVSVNFDVFNTPLTKIDD